MSQYLNSNEPVNKDSLWSGFLIGGGIGATIGSSNALLQKKFSEDRMDLLEGRLRNPLNPGSPIIQAELDKERYAHGKLFGNKWRTAGTTALGSVVSGLIFGGVGAGLDALHNGNKK